MTPHPNTNLTKSDNHDQAETNNINLQRLPLTKEFIERMDQAIEEALATLQRVKEEEEEEEDKS